MHTLKNPKDKNRQVPIREEWTSLDGRREEGKGLLSEK